MNTWLELNKVQPLVSKIMQNSIKKNRISHAYLMQGLRGTGKRALTTLFIKTLLCPNKKDIEPCHQCDVCNRVFSKNHPDVYWVEPDGRSIRNEQIDALRKEFSYYALESSRKVYVITHAETLTDNAANRLLKFLEEPTTKTTAILLTENKQAIISTIRSRCQELDLQPLNKIELQNKLAQEGIDEQYTRLLSALTNDVDEAILLDDEQNVYEIEKLVKQFIKILMTNYDERFLFIHQYWLNHLKEREQLELGIHILFLAFKDIIYAKVNLTKFVTLFSQEEDLLQQSINFFSQKRLLHTLKVISSTEQKLKQHIHPTLVMEQLVLQI